MTFIREKEKEESGGRLVGGGQARQVLSDVVEKPQRNYSKRSLNLTSSFVRVRGLRASENFPRESRIGCVSLLASRVKITREKSSDASPLILPDITSRDDRFGIERFSPPIISSESDGRFSNCVFRMCAPRIFPPTISPYTCTSVRC